MSGGLQSIGDDSPARCAICGDEAVGPCARCRNPTCGDCCVLTEGSAKVWAICLRCEKRGGRNLLPGWALVLAWVALPIVGLALALFLFAWLTG
ncbi:MAG: hypothetical protein JNK04_23305 [Myxococcales bacterium]|nr:hypothetical protein [Myxococcales bacterium]